MRRPGRASLLVLAVVGSPAAAQRGPQPTLVLTFAAGTHTGYGLWRIPRQPLTVLNTSQHDTLSLRRTVSAGFQATVAATYFATPHWGLSAEATYLSLPLDDACTAVFLHPDAAAKNQQLCDYITATTLRHSAFVVAGGVVARAAPRSAAAPYLRATVGVAILGSSTIALDGRFGGGTGIARQVIADGSPRHVSFSAGGAIGVSAAMGPGARLRLELRDDLLWQDAALGPADALGRLARTGRLRHHGALLLGLDLVLDRRRGRRY